MPSLIANAPNATTASPLNTPLHEEQEDTTEQSAQEEHTAEQTAVPADLTTKQDPPEPPQTMEPTVAHEPDATTTELHPVSMPPSDPIPPEPSILDIFDDA